MICDKDPLNASALRVAQQKMDERIAHVRQKYGIPEGVMPPDELLWLNDLTPRELERWTLRNRGKTTYARALAAKRRHDKMPRTLQELGYLRSRYVAYRDHTPYPCRVAAEVQRDDYGLFIVVDDFLGHYTGPDGTVHDATMEGYTTVIQQFLYCFEAVNAAIAALDGLAPPAPVKRFQQKSADEQDHRNNGSSLAARAQTNTPQDTTQRGNSDSASPDAFVNQDTIATDTPSMVSNLRIASWTPETLLALAARHLPVPPRPAESDTGALHRYLVQWYEPALWIVNELRDLEPSRAWAVTERRIVGMLAGPTWQAKHHDGRVMTLRNAVGPAKWATPLTGATWKALWDDMEKAHKWWPDTMTPYDGPPLLSYEGGYKEVAHAAATEPPIIVEEPEVPAPPVIVEPPEPPYRAPMTHEEAIALCNALKAKYPTLILAVAPKNRYRVQWYASIQTSPDAWHHFKSEDEWRLPSPEAIDALDSALDYARSLMPEEVPVATEDSPLIITDPPPCSVAPDAPEALPSSPRPQTEPLPTLAPAGKRDMPLWLAEALLKRVSEQGYQAELCLVGEDRATLSVETAPGTWIDVESARAWQEIRALLAQSPPENPTEPIVVKAVQVPREGVPW